jgi:hypothetical protein
MTPARSMAATIPTGGMGLKTNRRADAIAHRLALMTSPLRLCLYKFEESVTSVF